MAFQDIRAELSKAVQHNWKGKAFVIGIALASIVFNDAFVWSPFRIFWAVLLLFVVLFDQAVLGLFKRPIDKGSD